MSPHSSSTPSPESPTRMAAALALARDTKALILAPGALQNTIPVFTIRFPKSKAVVVADTTTHTVAGRQVQDLLDAAGLSAGDPVILPVENLYAEYQWIDYLVDAFRAHDAIPIAVGSGTINDLVKLAAHLTGRPYLCVSTAASMDGYTAYGASITKDGAKQTFNCPAPRAVIADIDIIRKAPPPMTAAGYADLQAKITAGADWIIADELGIEAIEPQAWSLVHDGLQAALAHPTGARDGDPAAVTGLTEGLMLGGFAMQWFQTSRPASGAEHQFSHLWDMEHLTCAGVAPSHGFKVGVSTLAIVSLYESLLRRPLDRIDIDNCCDRWDDWPTTERNTRARFAEKEVLAVALTESQVKHISRDALRDQLTLLRARWPALRQCLQTHLLPVEELQHRLQRVGAPVTPEAIGLTRERLRDSFQRAYHIRRRFTVLDLAVRTAQLEPCLDELFAPCGYWSTSA